MTNDQNNGQICDAEQPTETREIQETPNGYRTVYSTSDGRTGYVFTPRSDANGEMPGTRREKTGRSGRLGRVLLTVALCIAAVGLCFFGGYAGTVIAGKSAFSGQLQDRVAKQNAPLLEPASSTEKGNGSAVGGYTTTAEVVAEVGDSVVLIHTETYSENLFGEKTLTATGNASGVILSENGYILTNAHVVDGTTNVQVTLYDGTVLDAGVVGYDSASDLAVIKINTGDRQLTPVTLGSSSDLVAGEQVVIIGNPFGLGKCVASGMISAVDVECSVKKDDGTVMTLVPVVASVDPGDSGGGLFNMDGKLVGVINSRHADSGIGFAIPIDPAVGIINELTHYGYVRGVIDHGLSCVDVTVSNLQMYRHYGITQIGVYVVSSKYCADLKNKDQICAVNGVEVKTMEELEAEFGKYTAGDKLILTVSRGGETFETELELHEFIPPWVDVSET